MIDNQNWSNTSSNNFYLSHGNICPGLNGKNLACQIKSVNRLAVRSWFSESEQIYKNSDLWLYV